MLSWRGDRCGLTLFRTAFLAGLLDKIRRNLELTGLRSWFQGRTFSASQVARGKPAPDLFRYAARSLRVPARRCVVVEDSRHGVAAARAAGMPVVGFAGGITPAAQLVDANVVIQDMGDLLPAVDRLLGARS